jgi:predicted nucleic acid-binding OB-fold protein
MKPEYRKEVENHIKEYFKSFDDIKEIINIKCEKTFTDLGIVVNVWNVKTENEAYWVVEGDEAPMNLYTQNAHYLSADEAYSFHIGLTQRLEKRHKNEFKHVIEEIPLNIEHLKSINRKLNMASEKLSIDLEPEEFQSIGLLCRESLIDLSKELCIRNPELVSEKGLKRSDFKGVANAFIDYYIPGSENSDLRNYSRKLVDSAWSYNSMVVHSQNKKYPDAKIALLFTCTIISLIENLFFKHLGFDQELACSECGSLQIEFIEYEKDKIKQVCKKCNYEELITFAEE